MNDKWLKRLNEVPVKSLPNYKAAGPDVDGQFVDLIRIDQSDDEEIPDAAGAVVLKARSDMFRKSSGVSDSSWDTPLDKTAATTLSPERSRARFEKVRESFKKFFKDSPEYDEAIELARKMLNEERAGVLLEQ